MLGEMYERWSSFKVRARLSGSAGGAVIISVFMCQTSAAGVVHALVPGLYKIDVFLGDAQGRSLKIARQIESCISAEEIANHTVFKMLSESPISQCPAYNVCGGELRTGFVAQCLGGDKQSALGMFALGVTDFRGRIDIQDRDGKVVGTEIQYGSRVGNCPIPGRGKGAVGESSHPS